MIRATWLNFLFILWTMFSALFCILLYPIDRNRLQLYDRFSRFWGFMVFFLAGVKVIHHNEWPFPESNYLVMVNHESNLDAPLFIWQFPYKLRFVAKKELFWIPLFGLAMWLYDYIFVNRKNRKAAIRSMDRAAKKIQEKKLNILIFPEGTRASLEEKQLLPFKKGGFVLAIKSGKPIVPVGVAGSRECLPKGSSMVKKGAVAYRVGKPIATDGYTLENKQQLMDRVREEIDNLREKAREDLQAT